MDRLISEKQVLDVVDKVCRGSVEFRAIYDRCEELIKAIPSAEPKTVPIAVIRFDDDKLHEIVEEAVKNIEIEPKWIPVSERLPEKNMRCLVAVGKFYLTQMAIYSNLMGTIDHRIFYQGDYGYGNFENITQYVKAWMPLPKPYEPTCDTCEYTTALEYDDAKYHEEHGEVVVDKIVWEDAKRSLESYDFAKWVATEIFDDMWEYNKDAFAEIACRKLEKLGIVRAKGDEWELVEPTCDTCQYSTAAFNPCNACKDKSEYKPKERSEE